MDNKQLRQAALDELDFDPSIDSANIGIVVNDGIVTLSGHVSSYAQKVTTGETVRRVRGVLAVVDELEVRHPGDKKISDNEIARRALNILRWYEVIPQNAAQVTVEKGWVTLIGTAPWQYQRKSAEDAIRNLIGITGVTNNISIKPTVSSYDVKKKIENALTRHTEIEAQGIQVTVKDGNKVLLEGKVDSWEERTAVEKAAWSVTGVHAVEDRLVIAP